MYDTISGVKARRVWDSRGLPTLEVEVHSSSGKIGRMCAASGRSRGMYERDEQLDGGAMFGGRDVKNVVQRFNEAVAPGLVGLALEDQSAVDSVFLDSNRFAGFLGTNISTTLSFAVAKCAANSSGVPLWAYLQDGDLTLPVPQVQIFGGGTHAGMETGIQDFMVISPTAGSCEEALDRAAEIFHRTGLLLARRGCLHGVADEGGYWPPADDATTLLDLIAEAVAGCGYTLGKDVSLSLDIAASSLGRPGWVGIGAKEAIRTDEFLTLLSHWRRTYPLLLLEDPFHDQDIEPIFTLRSQLGDSVYIVGDDYFSSCAERIGSAGRKSFSGAVVKPFQAGSLTATKDAVRAAKAGGMISIMSGRSGESEDETLPHLAVAWRCEVMKVGGMARSERGAKWNELLRIEEEVRDSAVFGGEFLTKILDKPSL